MAKVLAASILLAWLSIDAVAHGGLRFSNPLDGATLGDTPTAVQLTFTEKPEPSLSSISVVDTSGARHEIGTPAAAAGDPLSLTIPVRPLPTGVYTVQWRVVSSVDGHSTSGSYAFGVRASPADVPMSTTAVVASPLEVIGRWLILLGLTWLIGALAAEIAGFGDPGHLGLAFGGCMVSAAGLALVAIAEHDALGAPLGTWLQTSIGRTWIWRAAALGAAGAGLIAARSLTRSPSLRRAALTASGVAALAAIAAHVVVGHASAAPIQPLPVIAQWAHVAASALWLGGLAALLIGLRGAPSEVKAVRVRRFSTVAAAGILIVLATGGLRAINELTSWSDLVKTGYGLTLSIKLALVAGIAALGAFNRVRSIGAAATNLRPLRLAGGGEVALGLGVLAAAALLATLPPPSSARALAGITADGSDFGTTVRVAFSAVSDQPGPNRFVTRVLDYDSRRAVRADRVTLRFTPLDDPGVPATSLGLQPQEDGAYTGSGANLSFHGRWRVSVEIERGGTSVEVPLEVHVGGPGHPVGAGRTP